MTQENSPKTAISFHSAKESAVYFERVFPVGLFNELVINLSPEWPETMRLKSLFPPKMQDNEFLLDFMRLQFSIGQYFLCRHAEKFSPEKLEGWSEKERQEFNEMNVGKGTSRKILKKRVGEFLKSIKDENVIVSDADFGDSFDVEGAELSLAMQNAKLIDASRASWNQIFEFREDAGAQMKLRRLRLFAFENYSGKSISFIEDDICRRREDYEGVVQKWGFETREGIINAVGSSKVLAGGGVASIASAALAMPIPAIIAAVATTGVEIAKLGIYLSKRNFELRQLIKENPFSFFEYANSKLTPPLSDLRK